MAMEIAKSILGLPVVGIMADCIYPKLARPGHGRAGRVDRRRICFNNVSGWKDESDVVRRAKTVPSTRSRARRRPRRRHGREPADARARPASRLARAGKYFRGPELLPP